MSVLPRLGRCAAMFACLLSTAHSVVVLPNTNGTYNVTISYMKLVDQIRLDPFAPTPQPRAVMISVFHPTPRPDCSSTSLIDYMPPTTAAYINAELSEYGIPSGTFSQLRLPQCNPKSRTGYSKPESFPVVLFSPALGTSRLFYSAVAMAVASSGYVVVSIDHPYCADIVEFPDGSTIIGGNLTTDAQILLDVEIRAGDVSFVLDQLSSAAVAKALVPGMSCGFDVGKVGIFGHSLGGATAALSMLNDSRIAAGLDLDGSIWGPVIEAGLDRPFVIFGRSGKNLTNDPTWEAFLPNLRGFKLELGLEGGSEHFTFSDLPLLVKILGFWDLLPDAAFKMIGRLDGARALQIVKTYVDAFFEFTLKGEKESPLLKEPSAAFPEVIIVVQ